MTFKKLLATLFIFQFVFFSNAQTDSLEIAKLKKKQFLKHSILPVSLITIGSIISGSSFEKNLQTNIRNSVGNDFELRIDDYLQYAPIAEMYIADAIGAKSKNHWFDQTKSLIISDLMTTAIVFSLKKITGKTRPNGSPNSFPSGHTAFAFTNAGILFNEFKNSNLALAYSGYGFATATGVFRMLNNKHWLSDVLVGAGIGILIPQIVYSLEPLKNWNPFKKIKGVSLFPMIYDNQYGFYAQINF